ncbi:M20 family metallopeptidase [Halotalea alkalilenta]|uniref:Amidohydrolase n=1 Tax=Halotalea alkalilenta TaxID=376489 RepID=A0A172YII0_9GAMM|nr:M20 family metallopeptidase [Halotalea alkalilenta]ANF58962.1 amidohydrolase [Halotalea alkalilenta]
MNQPFDIDPTARHLENLVEAKRERFIDAADRVWESAETRFEEHRSQQTLCELLEAEGFQLERGVGGIDTAFIASFGQGEPVIALLGEYDALAGLSQAGAESAPRALTPNGNGHGCGHNLLGVAALAGAVAARDWLLEQGLIGAGRSGTLRFYGCPGEEGGSGKTFMVREGLFDDVDLALTWHPNTMTCVFSQPTLANIQAYFRFKGRSAHAAASPHLGRSALDAVELMNVGANYLREHILPEARLHYSLTQTGGASPNVVQADAEVLYLVRAPEMEETQEIFERLEQIAQGAALMTGTQVEMRFDKACSNYLPNRTLEDRLYAQLQRFGAPDFDDRDREFAARIHATLGADQRAANLAEIRRLAGPEGRAYLKRLEGRPLAEEVLPYAVGTGLMFGSTDVGDVSWKVPTAQCFVTCLALGTPLHTWQVVSQGRSSLGHKGMLQAAKVLAATAVEAFTDEALRRRARAELDEALEERPYRCPIPAGISPSPLS